MRAHARLSLALPIGGGVVLGLGLIGHVWKRKLTPRSWGKLSNRYRYGLGGCASAGRTRHVSRRQSGLENCK